MQRPQHQIKNYSSEEWDEFIEEWAGGFDPPYYLFDRIDGAGDKGRDIVGYCAEPNSGCEWDNYQCKHYGTSLQPNHIWVELGKLCIYTHLGEYTIPRSYKFVSPRGVGTKLHDLLREPDKLKLGLIKNWTEKCEKKISSIEKYPLTGKLKTYVENFDFNIVSYIPVNQILEQHRKTRHWYIRFEEEKPDRPDVDLPPEEPRSDEIKYVGSLLNVYSAHLNVPIASHKEIPPNSPTSRHFNRSREWFYSADSLNRFSRDQVEPGTFEKLKQDILDGVIDTIDDTHEDAFRRVKETTDRAETVTPANSKLTSYVRPADKKGICHHLVNDDELDWMPNK